MTIKLGEGKDLQRVSDLRAKKLKLSASRYDLFNPIKGNIN
jgi:hypothetical protein